MFVVRAMPAVLEVAARSISEDAELSAEIYLLDLGDGNRELLYGVSVFAHRPGVEVSEVLARFPSAPSYAETSAGQLRAAGFPVHATGSNPDHYDVQLAPGVTETGTPPAPADVMIEARRLIEIAGGPRPSPSYAGHGLEEEP